jgi:hypothetical protein
VPTATSDAREPMSQILRASWAPWLVFLLHVFASRVLHAYLFFPPLDIPMHFFGGVAIAYFFAACVRALGVTSQPPVPAGVAPALLVFSLTCSTSVFWEFAEFFSDRLFGTHAQLSLEDTLLDMALGTAGGALFATWAWRKGALDSKHAVLRKVTQS